MENTVDSFLYADRIIIVYRMPNGKVRAFYRSLNGTEGKRRGQIYPFDGIDPRGWFIKQQYYTTQDGTLLSQDDPRFGYGVGPSSEDLKEACRLIQRSEWPHDLEDLEELYEVNRRLRKNGVLLSEMAL